MKAHPRLKDILLKPFYLASNTRLRRLILAGVIFALIYFILAPVVIPSRVDVEEGMPSPEDIKAPHEAVDTYTTEQLREEAAEEVPMEYSYNPEVMESSMEELEQFFASLEDMREDLEEERAEERINRKKEHLLNEYPGLQESDIDGVLQKEGIYFRELRENLKQNIAEEMEEGIRREELEEARTRICEEMEEAAYSPASIRLSEKLVKELVTHNKTPDLEATEEKREEARQEVEEVPILEGTLIVSEGEIITEKHIAQLEALGMLGGQAGYSSLIGLFLLLMVFFFTVGIYLYVFEKDVYKESSMLLLLGLIVIITLVFALGMAYFSPYLVPAAVGVILIAVLFNNNLAMLMNVILALLMGLVTDGDIGVMAMSLIAGMIAIYSVSRLSQRTDLVKAGIYVAAVNTLVILAVFMLLGNLQLEYGVLQELGFSLASGMGSGILSAVIAIGMLPFLETGFGLTTAVSLLELSNPNQPLLRKLLMKAPGTYHHSVLVGNLAEAAAENVGADALLVRVGAYYHDIGKINRPYFFTENQFSRENPHKKLSPSLSALVVRSHIKDGVEIARRERLPFVLIDIIRQHHGTSMISFFYQQAQEKGRNDNISEKNFRYEGPLPQTKEAAIIMLADAVEAGVRSLSRPVGVRIDGMVRRIIKEKLNDGQLDESDLTLKDLDQIGDTFVYILSSVYHTRIEYPLREISVNMEE